MSPFTCIAIDGGAATGKSSTAHLLAERLNYLCVNTGMHYRGLAWSLMQAHIAPEPSLELENFLKNRVLSTSLCGITALMSLDGILLDANLLNTQEVNDQVGRYAALPAVRTRLLKYQRGLVHFAQQASFSGIVMEGRDIGSVILPDAQFCFFLMANAQIRQQRRHEEGRQDDIQKRDRLDSQRTESPLKCGTRSVLIDTSELTLEQVVSHIYEQVQSHKPVFPSR